MSGNRYTRRSPRGFLGSTNETCRLRGKRVSSGARRDAQSGRGAGPSVGCGRRLGWLLDIRRLQSVRGREVQGRDRARRAGEQGLRSGSGQAVQRSASGRGEEIHRSGQTISGIGLGAQRPDHDDLRAISGGRLHERGDVGRALCQGISQDTGGRLRPLSRGEQLLRRDTRHFARSGSGGQSVGAVQEGRAGLSEFGICQRRQIQDPGHLGSTRRQGDVGRPLLSQSPQLHRRDQSFPRRPDATTRRRGMPRKRSIA